MGCKYSPPSARKDVTTDIASKNTSKYLLIMVACKPDYGYPGDRRRSRG